MRYVSLNSPAVHVGFLCDCGRPSKFENVSTHVGGKPCREMTFGDMQRDITGASAHKILSNLWFRSLSQIPLLITAGDTVSWRDDNLCVTEAGEQRKAVSSEFTLTYNIKSSSGGITVVAVADGDDWITTITSTQSATLTPGAYWANAQLSKTDFRQTVDHRQITVEADLGAISTFDGRTDAEKNLALVQAAITDIVTNGVSSYTIGSRRADRSDLDQLRRLRIMYLQSIAKAKRGGKNLQISFGGRRRC